MKSGVPDYEELPLGRFLEMMASREPIPGGGASAAVTVALAAALTSMAARFSTDHLADAGTIALRVEELRHQAVLLAGDDAAAYVRVLDAHRAASDGEEEKRSYKIRQALSEAADVPLAVAEIGVEVAGEAARLAKEGNPNLRGDAATAAILAGAGVRAASTLVEINISAGGDDEGRSLRAARLRDAAATHGGEQVTFENGDIESVVPARKER